MSLTHEDAAQVLEIWKARLCLDHWQIEFKEGDLPEDETWSEHRQAFIWRSRDYNTATLHLNPNFTEWNRRKLNLNIVHELLHLVTREVEFILDQLETLLHRDVDRVIGDGHRHAVEGAVDFLSYRFVELGGEV
jgi:hypothetical protein